LFIVKTIWVALAETTLYAPSVGRLNKAEKEQSWTIGAGVTARNKVFQAEYGVAKITVTVESVLLTSTDLIARYPSVKTLGTDFAYCHQLRRSLPLNETPFDHLKLESIVYTTVSGESEVSSADAIGPPSPTRTSEVDVRKAEG
jgi:hypothetical protein